MTAVAGPQVDVGLDPTQFLTQYEVAGVLAPRYRVFPAMGGQAPFNGVHTPEMLPCDLQSVDTQFQVTLAPGGTVVYPEVAVRFYTKGGAPIVSHGYTGTAMIAQLVMPLPPLAPGTAEVSEVTSIRAVSPSRDVLFQPKDLPRGTAVRMEIAVTPFAVPQLSQPVTDSNVRNNVMNFWLMRAR
jgi:hypothetical protein